MDKRDSKASNICRVQPVATNLQFFCKKYFKHSNKSTYLKRRFDSIKWLILIYFTITLFLNNANNNYRPTNILSILRFMKKKLGLIHIFA